MPDDDRDLVRLRLAEMRLLPEALPRRARRHQPYVEDGPRQAEALYFYALVAARARRSRRVLGRCSAGSSTSSRPDRWAEEALNHLATSYIRDDDDEQADETFRELYEKFPAGRYAERAAWKIGWRAYRTGDYRETAYVFSRAAADFPRSDYRPSWLYWAGRAHDALGDKLQAQARYTLAATDYLNSYYGRLALARLDGRAARTPARGRDVAPAARRPGRRRRAARRLVAAAERRRRSRAARREDLRPGRRRAALRAEHLGRLVGRSRRRSPGRTASRAQVETGSAQFSLYRGAINAMKRAYPQYLAAGGEQLPREILRIIYPDRLLGL